MERGERVEMNPEIDRINHSLDNNKKTDIKNQKADFDSPIKVGKEVNTKKIETSDMREKEGANDLNPIDRPIEMSNKFYSTYKQRYDMTPKNNGEWTGAIGESVFKSNRPEVIEALKKYGLEGIKFSNCVPEFSPVAETTVKIDMTEFRYSADDPTGKTIGNIEKADEACAKKWTKEKREKEDGTHTWNSRDVSDWRKANNFVWHECSDGKRCQLIPDLIHKYFPHLGGRKECELRDHPEKQNGISDVNDMFDK